MSRLPLKDVVLHYDQTGEGPDIVWIPGGDNVGSDWGYQVAGFEADFRNTTYDPRGAGETETLVPPPWSIADFAADCARLIEAVCQPPVFLVGLSMGSLITQQVALDRPDLVRCAVAMGTAARATGYLKDWMAAEIAFRRAGGRITGDMAIAHYGVLMYPPEVLADAVLWPKLRDFVAASYADRDDDMLIGQWQACVDFDVYDRLPDCRVPVHVFAFSHDVQAPWPYGKEVAERARDGHFHFFEGLVQLSLVGHKHEVVNSALREVFRAYL